MGDRANVYVHEGDEPGVYLYTHWSGHELPETVRTALARAAERWQDQPYLTRIIFDEMTLGHQGETRGYGITAVLGDGGEQLVDVDTRLQVVTLPGYPAVSFPAYVEVERQGWSGAETSGAEE